MTPQWLNFLAGVFPGGDAAERPGNASLIQFTKKYFGYSLTGDVREQILGILYGSGGNGKSTLMNAWLEMMGPDYAIKAPSTMLMASRNERHPTELANLFGKRLVCAAETEAGARLAESQVKELTGGDHITARRMKEDFWTFSPTHKMILSTNHTPKIKGRDHAIWRRLKLIPFTARFEGDEKDKEISLKLAAEFPGILAWSVAGCLEWQRNGLVDPENVKEATNDYRDDEDVLATWLKERCSIADCINERASILFSNYKEWAESSGDIRLPFANFAATYARLAISHTQITA